MSEMDEKNEIESARISHGSVSKTLHDSPLLLSATNSVHDPLLHQVIYDPKVLQEALALNQLTREVMTGERRPLPRPGTGDPIPHGEIQTRMRQLLKNSVRREAKDWYYMRHHSLLHTLIGAGVVPNGWDEQRPLAGIETPQPLTTAYQEANKRGFDIPESMLDEREESSYGETEAFYAAKEISSGRFTFPLEHEDHQRLRQVVQVSSSFLIPHWKPGAPPFVADQLWIVGGPGQTVRLLILEVDGEYHLDPERQRKDERRDAHFNELGYEVYRVAGWWARIDPFRVIMDVLERAMGMKSLRSALQFAPSSIGDYRCFACGKPMTRWDDNWIAADYKSNHVEIYPEDDDATMVFVHQACSKEA